MADQVPAVSDVLASIGRRNWERCDASSTYHDQRDGRMIRWIDALG